MFSFFIFKFQKTITINNDKNPIERIIVNIDNTLECLLREIRYITGQPLNLKIPSKFRELIPLLDNDRTLRYVKINIVLIQRIKIIIIKKNNFSLNVERLRSIAMKYNYLIESMELEEKLLFEPKLNRIEQVFLNK